MEFENIKFEENSGIAFLIFNRPKALNALNQSLLMEMDKVLDIVSCNESIRVLVLTGAGDKAFVAGADISELADFTPHQAKVFSDLGQGVMDKLQKLSIPVIAAVNGFALGGGSEMALACDFIYASENAVFGLPELTLGLIPGFGGTQRLPRLVGKNMAKELIFTAKNLKAEKAEELGIVNKVVPLDELNAEVLKTAKKIALLGRESLMAAKEAVNKGMDVDLSSGCHIEKDAFAICFASEDAKEGTSAFLEKRKPEFNKGFNLN